MLLRLLLQVQSDLGFAPLAYVILLDTLSLKFLDIYHRACGDAYTLANFFFSMWLCICLISICLSSLTFSTLEFI